MPKSGTAKSSKSNANLKSKVGACLDSPTVVLGEWPHEHLAKCKACGSMGATFQCKFQKEGASAWHSLCAFCGKDHANIYCPNCKHPDIVYCCNEHMDEDSLHHKDRCFLQQHLNEAAGLVKRQDYKQATRKLQKIQRAAKEKELRWVEAEATRSLGHCALQLLDRPSAMQHLKEALLLCKDLQDLRGMAYCYMDMAQAYAPQNLRDRQALDFADKAIALAEEEVKAAEALCAGRCDAFQRSEFARSNALLNSAHTARGRIRVVAGTQKE
mmetsp:Transcript_13778/g.18934  ORF Transcript_13778/g.18934 Transcript_13778/m.18934 type:complete len:270 (+) Transcript_13778:400-1209(+)|eukprot:CAMPEP_0196583058 /NCGR_PEP_ID=MMETSP1081-20130531/41844_1 /TAXON_ID=36882 /ORGANISM="Pyramimonas amylifera, Strain CCMP720" /LENGTH=269 /DNA_ID=CAMNT_0041903819 /DNA_START=253 /DNA_END=1062 /DNA_ORIENTATION=+